MTQAATQQAPIEKMCVSFPHMRLKSDGIWTNDDNPRFDCYENENGVIGINPWTGRSVEDVLKMGNPPLTFADLYPHDDEHPYIPSPHKEKPLDLLTLAAYYRLPWQYLYALGYRDGHPFKSKNGYRTRCVRVGGYTYPDGTDYPKKRLRLSLDGKNRFRWDTNTPGDTIPCGLHRLDDAVKKGYLFLGEGESDAATMWFHDFPYLGISGAGCYKQLDVSLLQDIPRLYIIEEPDQSTKNEQGQGFYADIHQHLRENGYTGDIFSLRWKLSTNYKDPSSVHKSIYRSVEQDESIPDAVAGAEVKRRFAEVVAKALQLAIPEGNTALVLAEYNAVVEGEEEEQSEPPALPATDDERFTWLKEMARVSHKVLSDRHKLILLVIMLHSPVFNLKEEVWWRVDAEFLAKQADMDKDDFLAGLSYLTKKVNLFEKRYEQTWYQERGESKVKTLLYIQPSETTWVTYPSTWQLVKGTPERNHGGTRTPKPKCPVCQSENVDVYNAFFCYDCKAIHYTPKANAPALASEKPPEEEEEEEDVIESTVEEVGRQGEEDETGDETEMVRKNGTATPKMGYIDSSSLYIYPKLGDHESASQISQKEQEKENDTGNPKMGYPVPFSSNSHICHVDHSQKSDVGLLVYCSECDDLAKHWISRVPYCPKHEQQRRSL